MLNRHASNAGASMAAIKKYVPIMETEYAREEAPRRVWMTSHHLTMITEITVYAGASKTDG